MLSYIKQLVKQLVCSHDWIERKPTPFQARVYSTRYRFWICSTCSRRIARKWNKGPREYRASRPPTTEHYENLRQGLEPYFRDRNHRTPTDCMAHILYDLIIWDKGHTGDAIVPAFQEAYGMYREYLEREMKWLEERH